MSVVRFTSAQLAEQAFAAVHRCAGDSAASSSLSASRTSCWVGESGKDGSESSLSSAGSLSDQEEGCCDDDEWDDDDVDDGELVDERFLDPDSPLGRAMEIIGRARNLSSVPAQFVHRLDPDWLARADGFAEHCCDRLWTLEALRGSDCLGTYSTHLSDGTLDSYRGFHGERAQDASPHHIHEASIRQREGLTSSEEATAVTAAAAEAIPTPTPRPGPPRLGRPSNSSSTHQFFETAAALLTQARAPASAVSARMPTPRRRSPPVSTPVATGGDDSRNPASMPESARQELYELYQYTSNGSRARHASSGGGGGGGGDRATETDSLASGLQQIDLDPLRLTGPSSGEAEDEANEAARELWYEEEEIVEEAEEEDELAEQDLHEHLQRCDDLEAEAAERERDQSEQARRQRSGGPVGR